MQGKGTTIVMRLATSNSSLVKSLNEQLKFAFFNERLQISVDGNGIVSNKDPLKEMAPVSTVDGCVAPVCNALRITVPEKNAVDVAAVEMKYSYNLAKDNKFVVFFYDNKHLVSMQKIDTTRQESMKNFNGIIAKVHGSHIGELFKQSRFTCTIADGHKFAAVAKNLKQMIEKFAATIQLSQDKIQAAAAVAIASTSTSDQAMVAAPQPAVAPVVAQEAAPVSAPQNQEHKQQDQNQNQTTQAVEAPTTKEVEDTVNNYEPVKNLDYEYVQHGHTTSTNIEIVNRSTLFERNLAADSNVAQVSSVQKLPQENQVQQPQLTSTPRLPLAPLNDLSTNKRKRDDEDGYNKYSSHDKNNVSDYHSRRDDNENTRDRDRERDNKRPRQSYSSSSSSGDGSRGRRSSGSRSATAQRNHYNTVCKFFLSGCCKYGSKCSFKHS